MMCVWVGGPLAAWSPKRPLMLLMLGAGPADTSYTSFVSDHHAPLLIDMDRMIDCTVTTAGVVPVALVDLFGCKYPSDGFSV